MLSHNYDYKSTLETSQRVNWKLDDVIAGRTLDFTKPFLPDSLVGVNRIGCLSADDKLVLNHIRGFTYLFLFGFIEEYIVPFNIDHARTTVHGDDHELRAILHFTEEEAKHIQMFKWFVSEFRRSFTTPCETIGPVSEVVPAILAHSRLGVAITTLCVEWMSQRHYVDGIKNANNLDPLFTSMLEHHWLEEAQHAKLDTLMVEKLAAGLSPAEIDSCVDDFIAIGKMLDGALQQQARFDIDSLATALGRTFTDAEAEEIVAIQIKSYRWTFLASGMTHPNFEKTLRELAPKGHGRVAELVKALM
ncbi:MAG TPA: diiron oxygenase [Kofleriaceae bacterium]|jgi:hypothetical protein|nr:diiron oxygenase [Kofleriaceae bacterium]